MKKSVSKVVALALLTILFLAVSITLFAISTLSSALNDASVINAAGSLRMQAYRFAHDIQNKNPTLPTHVLIFEQTLAKAKYVSSTSIYKNEKIQEEFENIISLWLKAKSSLLSNYSQQYFSELENFVLNIDKLVLSLQKSSEQKLLFLAILGGSGLFSILLLILFLIHYTQTRIVTPLNQLVAASQKIQQGNFDIKLYTEHANELSLLSNHFIAMANELKVLYLDQEVQIQQKTQRLQKANHSLQILYRCTTELSSIQLNKENFVRMIEYILDYDGIDALCLVQQHPRLSCWKVEKGTITSKAWQTIPLSLDKISLGVLKWQGDKSKVDHELLNNISGIFSRGIYYLFAQKQALHIAVMEERSIFARELHDSIAQSLSYLKIQLALLKRAMQNQEKLNQEKILLEISAQLNSSYEDLRTLISAFRLSAVHSDFSFALNEMLEDLRRQSDLKITLNHHFNNLKFDTHHMMHVLMIIREACTNTIKHASAKNIQLDCQEIDKQIEINIVDDGVGFSVETTKAGHFGLSIMKERAFLLGGKLDILTHKNQGCRVRLTFTL